MLCFLEGCSYACNGPGSVSVTIHIGTRGSIGTSEARVNLGFCSPECVCKFFQAFPTQDEILREVYALQQKTSPQAKTQLSLS